MSTSNVSITTVLRATRIMAPKMGAPATTRRPTRRAGRDRALLAVAFLGALAATASCRQIAGIQDLPKPCADPMMIDDMEDGDAYICESGGRHGPWFTVSDGTSTNLTPAEGAPFTQTLIPGGRGASRYAARMTGSGFTGWGVLMGLLLNVEGAGHNPYNASATSGIKFWMKSDAPVSVELSIPGTSTPINGGDCVDTATKSNCNNHYSFVITKPSTDWLEYEVPYAALTQHDGTPAVANPPPPDAPVWNASQLIDIQFVAASAFDVWVDDLRFFLTCSTPGCAPTCSDPTSPVACPPGNGHAAGCWPEGTDCANPPDPTYNSNVWGSGPNDVWIVGASKNNTRGNVFHWNGVALSAENISDIPFIWGIWGSGPDDFWTFGNSGSINRRRAGVWSAVVSPTTSDLYQGAWGSAADDIWAAGAGGTIVRWNGTTWSVVPSHTTEELWGMWGSGPDDVWAVGAGGTALRWNGSDWQATQTGTTKRLDGVWGSGPGDVWATGETLLRWNGTSWTNVPSGTDQFLEGAWGTGPDDVWVIGGNGTILHWDGSGVWQPHDSGTSAYLDGIWGSAPDDVWVVGTGSTILHYDGNMWTPVAPPVSP